MRKTFFGFVIFIFILLITSIGLFLFPSTKILKKKLPEFVKSNSEYVILIDGELKASFFPYTDISIKKLTVFKKGNEFQKPEFKADNIRLQLNPFVIYDYLMGEKTNITIESLEFDKPEFFREQPFLSNRKSTGDDQAHKLPFNVSIKKFNITNLHVGQENKHQIRLNLAANNITINKSDYNADVKKVLIEDVLFSNKTLEKVRLKLVGQNIKIKDKKINIPNLKAEIFGSEIYQNTLKGNAKIEKINKITMLKVNLFAEHLNFDPKNNKVNKTLHIEEVKSKAAIKTDLVDINFKTLLKNYIKAVSVQNNENQEQTPQTHVLSLKTTPISYSSYSWSKRIIEPFNLEKVHGELQIKAKNFDIYSQKTQNANFTINFGKAAENDFLKISTHISNIFGGDIDTEAHISQATDTKCTGKFSANKIDLSQLIKTYYNVSPGIGQISLSDIELNGNCLSQKDLMRSINGSLKARITNGKIEFNNISQTALNQIGLKKTLEYDEANSQINIKDGLAKVENFKLSGVNIPKIFILEDSHNQVNFATKNVDLKVWLKGEHITGADSSQYIYFHGPWDNIQVSANPFYRTFENVASTTKFIEHIKQEGLDTETKTLLEKVIQVKKDLSQEVSNKIKAEIGFSVIRSLRDESDGYIGSNSLN